MSRLARALGGALVLLLWPLWAAAQEIVVIGDSVMEWWAEDGGAIADVISDELGLPVENRAVSGARLSHPGLFARLGGLDIRRQLGGDRPDIVILTAGANDLGGECGCGACAGVLNGLIAEDLRGELSGFVAELTRDGVTVIYLGYYGENGQSGFIGCSGVLTQLHDRMKALDGRLPGYVFVSARQVIDPGNPGHYDRDRTHPSREGAALIGALLAEAVEGVLEGS